MAQTRRTGMQNEGRSYPMRRGFRPTIMWAPGEPLIGYDSGKLLGLFDPTLNGGYPRKQTHLVFLLIARFERGVQMIRPALSKFDNRINARRL